MRQRVRAMHRLTPEEADSILAMVATNAIIREPTEASLQAPDPDDQHVWDLLVSLLEAILVTGDATLVRGAPRHASGVLPRIFVESL